MVMSWMSCMLRMSRMSCLMLLTVTLDGGLQPLPELEADGGHHEAGVRHELAVPHLTSGHGEYGDGVMGRLQIFGTMHKKMQISLKWLKYRLKILKSSFIYYFYIVPVVPKLKKLKKSPYDQNNRNWMSHWHHANYHIFCNFHWKFGTQPLKPFISIST